MVIIIPISGTEGVIMRQEKTGINPTQTTSITEIRVKDFVQLVESTTLETTNVETIEEAGNEFPRSHPILKISERAPIEGGKSPRHPLMRHPVLDTPVGNVPQCLEEWKKIGAPEWILLGIENGFRVELHKEPTQGKVYHLPCTGEKAEWIAEKLIDYLQRGNTMQTNSSPRVISPFFVIPKEGPKKYRLIVDLRQLNFFTKERPKIRMQSLEEVLPLIKEDSFMVTMDLQDYYLHFRIHPDSQKYLAIEIPQNIMDIMCMKAKEKGIKCSREKFMEFTTLTFGWKDSAYIALKIMRVVYNSPQEFNDSNRQLRRRLPDNRKLERGMWEKQRYRGRLFQEFGAEKTGLKGSMGAIASSTHLGLVTNAKEQKIFIPNKKLKTLYSLIAVILKKEVLPRRLLARVAGKLNAVQLAFLPARYCARAIYLCLY
jgi:hypothetical protein